MLFTLGRIFLIKLKIMIMLNSFKSYYSIFCLIFFANLVQAAEISVSSDRVEIYKNELINLEIIVKDTKLLSNIDLSGIQEQFQITKQTRRSSHTIIQNKASRSEIFQLQLKPKKSGTLLIPAITVNTSNGLISSKSFTVNVIDEIGTSEDNKTIANVEATIDHDSIYFGEYAILKLKVTLFEDLLNAQITIPESKSAVIEKIFSIPAQIKTVNGKKTEITEIIYKIKPLFQQDIKIEPIILTGDIKKTSNQENNFFNNNVFFNYNLDNFEQINIASNKIKTIKVLDLQDANIASTEFKSTQEVSNIKTDVNTPINLSIKFETYNNSSDMIPEIELTNNDMADFYQEKTLTNEEYDPLANKIKATKIQNFTIIPKKAGALTIDEVLIPWLNKNNNQITNLVLPSINFEINDLQKIDFKSEQTNKPIEILKTESIPNIDKKDNKTIIYLLIIILILSVYSVFLTIKLFKFKINKINKSKSVKHILKSAETHNDIKLYLFQFFEKKYKKEIENFDDIKLIIKNQNLTEEIITDLLNVIKKLEMSLYGKHIYDFDFLKDEIKIKLKYLKKC